MPSVQTQVAVNFIIVNRPDSPADALLNPPEKARGFLSFLTWPFILAQLFWVEHVFGNVIRPAAATNVTNTHNLDANNHPAGDVGDNSPSQPFAKSVVDLPVQQDDGPGSHATLGGAAPVVVSAEYLRLNPDNTITGQHQADLLDIGGIGGGGNNQVVAVRADLPGLENSDGTLGHQVGSSVFDDLFGHTEPLSSASPILADAAESHSVNLAAPPGSIGQPLLTQAEPVIVATLGTGPVGHIIGDTVSLLDAAPTTIAATTEPVVYSVSHLVGDVGSLLDLTSTTLAATTDAVIGTGDQVVSTAAPVFELVPTVLASATVLTPTITDVSNSHLGDSGATAPALAYPVLSLVSAPATALDVSSSAPGFIGISLPVSAASNSLDSRASFESALPSHDAGFLGSPGTISIIDPPPSPIAPDQLFSAGQYTVYGVTLSTDATTNANSVPQPLDHGAGDVTNILDPHATTDNTHNQTTVVDHSHDLVASLSHTSSHVGDGIL